MAVPIKASYPKGNLQATVAQQFKPNFIIPLMWPLGRKVVSILPMREIIEFDE